jgi:hypothetical protein
MKLKKIPQLLGLLLMISCSSSKQGRVIQGENGKIKSAVINAKCTPPQKSYAKDLTVKVKAEIDSLRFVPTAVFESAFEQKVVKLRDYSTQGLDIELMMFHICEMANNRGLTSEQTASLIEKAISIYNKPATINQTVTSYNQQGGITAGNVYFETPKRKFDNNLKFQFDKLLKEFVFNSIEFAINMNDTEAFELANEMDTYFKYVMPSKKSLGISQVVAFPPLKGLSYDTSQLTSNKLLKIQVGSKQ